LGNGHFRVFAKGKPTLLSSGLPKLHAPQLGANRHDLDIEAAAIRKLVGLVLGFGVLDLTF